MTALTKVATERPEASLRRPDESYVSADQRRAMGKALRERVPRTK